MDFIPNLEHDAALQCIMRVTYDEFANAAKVSRNWDAEIEHPDFHKIRRESLGVTQPVIVLLQAVEDLEEAKFRVRGYNPPMRNNLRVLNFKTGSWSDLPSVPELRDGMPQNCRFAGVGTELVVIGGTDPVSSDLLDSVFIYNFISGEWRRGASMPLRRLHFGCASDSNRMVYVAGGMNMYGHPTKNLMAYDVAEDRWSELPHMEKERYSCDMFYRSGKLQLGGDIWTGYGIRREVGVFDFKKAFWPSLFSDYTTGLGFYVEGSERRTYKLDNSKVMAKKDESWEVIVKFPKEMSRLYFATMWQRQLIVIGAVEYPITEKGYIFGEEYELLEYKYFIEAYSLDMDNNSWNKLGKFDESVYNIMDGCFHEV